MNPQNAYNPIAQLRIVFGGTFVVFGIIAIVGTIMHRMYVHRLDQIESMCQFVNHCVHIHQNQIGVTSWGGPMSRTGIVGSAIALVMFCMSLILRKKSS